VFELGRAGQCLQGWPIVLGSQTQDGDTTVTTWQAGGVGKAYLIGGHSFSPDFTETEDGVCNELGCAYVTYWYKKDEKHLENWVFTKMETVINIGSQPRTKNSVVVFKKRDAQITLSFIKWSLNSVTKTPQAEFQTRGYDIDVNFGQSQLDNFPSFQILHEDRLHLVVNNADGLKVRDYYFLLGSPDNVFIDAVYSEEMSTARGPTRKTFQAEGWDATNAIQLATITRAKGEKELGGGETLGSPATYAVVISKTFASARSPFSIYDRMYGFRQDSPTAYYEYTTFTQNYRTNSNGVSTNLISTENALTTFVVLSLVKSRSRLRNGRWWAHSPHQRNLHDPLRVPAKLRLVFYVGVGVLGGGAGESDGLWR